MACTAGLLLILNICGVHSRPYHSYAKLHVVSSDTGGPAMVHVSGADYSQIIVRLFPDYALCMFSPIIPDIMPAYSPHPYLQV